jgi:hypothetical protein
MRRLVLSCGVSIALIGVAVTLDACSSDANRSNLTSPASDGNVRMRYYGGPKNGLWPDVDAKARN